MQASSEYGAPDAQRIIIPYTPRKHFLPIHRSKKRWKFVVMHRRAGKSVGSLNEMIKAALQNTRVDPPPRYGYVGPSFDQTKDLIWGYVKQYTSGIPGIHYSEGDLSVTFPNGATIRLYGGAAAFERMRGLYFDGIMLDEFPLLNPAVFSTVVRPCLADYRGWAIISGTSNGDDHFHDLLKKNRNNPAWDFFIVPVTDTDALHPDEVTEMTSDMSPEEYAREMLCRFDAPIEGAYYAAQINELEARGRITGVPYQEEARVITWWDLGIDDNTVIWFLQIVGREVHFIDFHQENGKSLKHYADVLASKGYTYAAHVGPHDIAARELGTGRSRKEVLESLVYPVPVIQAPGLTVEDGISAVRTVLPLAWFDKEKTADGLSALRNYHRSKQGKPVHNWASHPSDAFRIGSVALNLVKAYTGSTNVTSIGSGRLRRRVRGLA